MSIFDKQTHANSKDLIWSYKAKQWQGKGTIIIIIPEEWDDLAG